MNNLLEKLKIYGPKQFLVFAMSEVKRKIWMETLRDSYSQNGEDLLIDKLLNNKKRGFYVDIGAYDPHHISNTKRFYKRGWKGINIEPNTANYSKFLLSRRRDINLNYGIGSKNKPLIFYNFIPDTLSTFSSVEASRYIKKGYLLRKKSKVAVRKLADILEKYARNVTIDFFSIDTEGFEIRVLKSNNWKKFRPKVICIESSVHTDPEKTLHLRRYISSMLKKEGYTIAFENNTNSLFRLRNEKTKN